MVECEVHTYAEIAPLQYEIFKFITLSEELGQKPNEISSSGFDGLLRDESYSEISEDETEEYVEEEVSNSGIVTPFPNTTVNDPPPPPPPPATQPVHSGAVSATKLDPNKVDYSKYCNESLTISNPRLTLYVGGCTKNTITFVVLRDPPQPSDGSPPSLNKVTNKFQFDFRYYRPYFKDDQKKGGVYVFKTEDKDSLPYDHYITRIQLHRGNHLE